MEDRYLFRGKRVDNGEWVVGFLIQTQLGATSIIPSNSKNWKVIEAIPKTVGQCTGQKDKNKKLIYEHDQFIEQGRLYTIEWGEEGAWYAINDDCADTIYFNEWDYFKDIEIIGNIHDSKAVDK